MGERMRNGFSGAFTANGIKAQVTGIGSVIGVHWTDEKIVNGGDVVRGAKSPETFRSFCIWNCSTRAFFPAAAGCISFLLQ